MSEALQPPVHLRRYFAVPVVEPVKNVLPSLSRFGNVEIFIGDEFRNGKTVVKLHHADFLSRVGNARLFIGSQATALRCHEVIPIPIVVAHLLTAAEGKLERLDGHRILNAHIPSLLHRGHNGAGRAVAHPAAVKKPQRIGNNRCGHDLFNGNGPPEVGFGIEGAVFMTFHRNLGHGPFEFLFWNTVLGCIGGGQLRKGSGRRHIGVP